MTEPAESALWQALREHHAEIAGLHLRDLFRGDPGRAEAMTIEDCGLLLDYSKHRATEKTIQLLAALAGHLGVEGRR